MQEGLPARFCWRPLLAGIQFRMAALLDDNLFWLAATFDKPKTSLFATLVLFFSVFFFWFLVIANILILSSAFRRELFQVQQELN